MLALVLGLDLMLALGLLAVGCVLVAAVTGNPKASKPPLPVALVEPKGSSKDTKSGGGALLAEEAGVRVGVGVGGATVAGAVAGAWECEEDPGT